MTQGAEASALWQPGRVGWAVRLGGGGVFQEEADICIPVADSC